MTTRRLLMAFNADTGERWVEEIEGEPVPKRVVRHGTDYEVIMAAPLSRIDTLYEWWTLGVRSATLAVALGDAA